MYKIFNTIIHTRLFADKKHVISLNSVPNKKALKLFQKAIHKDRSYRELKYPCIIKYQGDIVHIVESPIG